MDLNLAWLALAALGTSALTAVAGLGGGIVLLSLMLLVYDPLVAIPLHGAIQLVSNGSRTVIQRRHVRWDIMARFAVLLVPAGALGLLVANRIPENAARMAIGVFVLLVLWAPRVLFFGARPSQAHPTRRFFWLGGVVGFLNTIVGATGPLQGAFFEGIGLTRHGVIGTFAASQALGHLVKIGLFAAGGFAFGPHALAFVVLAACVSAGTWIGSRALDRLDERTFQVIYRATLTLVALHLAVWEPLTSLL